MFDDALITVVGGENNKSREQSTMKRTVLVMICFRLWKSELSLALKERTYLILISTGLDNREMREDNEELGQVYLLFVIMLTP